MDPGVDLYRLLEVDPTASSTDIVRAYRRLARRWHPDVATSPRAAEHFAKITAAYRVLSDPAARARYDAASRTPRPRATHRADGAHAASRNSPWSP